MALKKKIKLDNGVNVSYHKISDIVINNNRGMVIEYSIRSFVDEATRRDKNLHVVTHRYIVEVGEDGIDISKSIFDQLYTHCQTLKISEDSTKPHKRRRQLNLTNAVKV